MTANGRDDGLPSGAAIVVLTRGGIELAQRIKPALPGARIHAPARRAGAEDADETFGDAAAHLRKLFAAGIPIIAVCAAGIAIRALAPLLSNKSIEPPVVALAEDGSSAVPLLGGHKGANALARAIARKLGGTAAITTAGDLRLGLALDQPPAGWRIANPEAVKETAAALLAGEPVALRLEAGDGGWLSQSGMAFSAPAPHAVRISDRAGGPAPGELLFHPPVLAIGLGCERGAASDEAIALARSALADAGFSPLAVACVCSLDIKEDEPAVHAVASDLGVPARFFDSETLEAETPRLANPSDLVFKETGTHGVAEAAALAAGGPDAALIVPKTKSTRVTCAVARAPEPIDAAAAGHARGELYVVGIGPGDQRSLSPEARKAIAAASDLVGYSLYLDLLGDWAAAKRHAFALGEEEARCRHALDLAAGGRSVALVSSGDAGIYGLASLVLELIDREDRAGWNRIRLAFLPGISAMQAAAAAAGAPLNHDFCAISLSDLLTPWPEIENRLRHAAAGDFVIALYNPASKRRRDRIGQARDILLANRDPETPVVVARNLGRAGESLSVVALRELAPRDIDMLTVIVIGNSKTRVMRHGGRPWVYTPRGYLAGETALGRKRGRS